MVKKIVKMSLSSHGYENFKIFMKKMKFKNEDYFLKYCTLNTIKSLATTPAQKKQIAKEMSQLKNAWLKKK